MNEVKNGLGKILNLGSSSSGNLYYVEIREESRDKPFILVIEAGFSYNEILRRLTKERIDINTVDAFLISHEHNDHSMGGRELASRGFKIYAPYTLDYATDTIVEKQWTYLDKNIKVLGFPLLHQDKGKDIYNLGYIISVGNDFNMLYVIDTRYIPQDLSQYKFDVIFIEANYLEDKVMWALRDAKRRQSKGNIARYSRLVNSHMSLENLARTLDGSLTEDSKPFDLSNTKLIFLTHLSSGALTNEAYYKVFLTEYLKQTKKKTKFKDAKIVICKKDGGFL